MSAPPSSALSNAAGPSLVRADSRTSITSIHAQNALRRMATHETGGGVERRLDGRDREGMYMEKHDEDHEHDHHSQDEITRNDKALSHTNTKEPLDVEKDDRRPSTVSGHGDDAMDGNGGKGSRKGEVVLQDQTNLLPVKQILVVFAGLSMALMCSMLDQTIVTTALPTLGEVFNRADIQSWVGTAYLLTSTAMQPIYGRLSDIFGRKPCLLASLVIFFIGALGCSLSQSMIMLIVFRAIEGVGGGGILTLSMIIVSDIVTLEERGKYQGLIGIVVATSNSVGPIIGGALTEKASWRWCFWLNLPITFCATIIILFLLPLKRVKGSYMAKLKVLDWWGSFLTLAWSVLVLIALSWAGSQHPWDSAAVLAPLIIGLALLVAFLWIEVKWVRLPLIPLSIFRNKTVSGGMAVTFLSGISFYCTLYYLPTYFQLVRGLSAIRSGELILPLTCVQTVCVFIAGFLVSKTGDYYWNLTFGFGIWTIGLGLMSTLGPDTPIAHIVGYQVVLGVGAGQTFQTSLVAIQAAVERKDMATATGTRNFLRMLGGTIGLAACGTLVNNLAGQELRRLGYSQAVIDALLRDPKGGQVGVSDQEIRDIRVSFAKGINGVFYLLIPCVGLAFFCTIALIKRIPLKRADDAARKEEAKQWVADRKKKHSKARKGSDHSLSQAEEGDIRSATHSDETAVNTPISEKAIHGENRGDTRAHAEPHHATLHKVEHQVEQGLEAAGRAVEEAAGVGIPRKEGYDQGPMGSERI